MLIVDVEWMLDTLGGIKDSGCYLDGGERGGRGDIGGG